MADRGVHIVGTVPERIEPLVFDDEHGPISVVALPYAEPPAVRERLGDETIQSHDQAARALVARAHDAIPRGRRSIAIAHVFVAGGGESESERPLAIGGSAAVASSCFAGFTYTALGHLHRPQTAGSEHVRYSGSLLKYSFSEASHAKSVTIVELDAEGVRRCEPIALTPRRDVRVLEGTLEEILAGPVAGQSREDYVEAVLTDRGALLDPMGRLREVYPNCLHIDRSAFLASTGAVGVDASGDRRGLGVDELFDEFVRQVSGEPLTDAEAAAFREIVGALPDGERDREEEDRPARRADGAKR